MNFLKAILARVIGRRLTVRLRDSFRTKFDEVYLIYRYFEFVRKPNEIRVMVDVGAHYGESAERFLLEGWNVHCFEPDIGNFQKLSANLKSFDNVDLVQKALSNVEATLPFYRSTVSDGINSLLSFHESHESVYSVSVTTLQEYLKKANVKHIDFLKIDVEGYEFFVLQGIDFSSTSISIICLEFEDRKTEKLGLSIDDLIKSLVEQGYHILVAEWEPISQYGAVHKFKKLHRMDEVNIQKNSWGNIIACRDINALNWLSNNATSKI